MLLLPALGWGQTCDATCGTNGLNNSCTPSILQTLIDDASTMGGDTICIASGTHAWLGQTIINKAITVTGQGACTNCGQVLAPSGTWPAIIDKGTHPQPAFVIRKETAGGLVRFSGLHIQGTPPHSYNCGPDSEGAPGIFLVVSLFNRANWRVDNMQWEDTSAPGSGEMGFAEFNHDHSYGVVDNNYIWTPYCTNSSDVGNGLLLQVQACGDNAEDPETWTGRASWAANPDGVTTFENVFFEDNTVVFNPAQTCVGTGGFPIYVDMRRGGKSVWRHNYLAGGFLSQHGTRGGGNSSQLDGRLMIAYNNTFTSTWNRTPISIRGGSAFIHDNDFTDPDLIVMGLVWGFGTGLNCGDAAFPMGCCDGSRWWDQNLASNGDSGTATGGSATSLIDTSKAWTTNQWLNPNAFYVHNTSEQGTGVGEADSANCIGLASANTSNQITIGPLGPACTGNGQFDADETYKITDGYFCRGSYAAGQLPVGADPYDNETHQPQNFIPMRWWNNGSFAAPPCGTGTDINGMCIIEEVVNLYKVNRDYYGCDDDQCPWVAPFLATYTPSPYPHPLRGMATSTATQRGGVSRAGVQR